MRTNGFAQPSMYEYAMWRVVSLLLPTSGKARLDTNSGYIQASYGIRHRSHLDPPGSGHASGRKTLRVFAQTPNTSSGFVLSVAHTVPLSLTQPLSIDIHGPVLSLALEFDFDFVLSKCAHGFARPPFALEPHLSN
ncbi:hypothetical protein PAXRUDRAFT_19062 [Paxillus rubicundulus Ve08.2h10]|uniref:Uncharacterized protein n=1 Tax=Paxillus rubicundulus Ve08.2h10 TaxID=930991 RepID=A0A0D0BVE1_9AGAM|nr:hypothetical protein PAXRUDRAFT_19062 [Paxillus rubicundulus Ve08.2h10]